MKTRILGFDISSTTIGYCILDISEDSSIKIIKADYFKPPKIGTIFDRLKQTQYKIIKILDKYKPDVVAIEDIVQYMPKVSSANTIITLALFNRMVGLVVFDYLQGKSPIMLNIMSIRHTIKRKCNLAKIPSKEELPQHLDTLLDKACPIFLKKNGKIAPMTYDVSDAVACAYVMSQKLIDANV